MREWLSGRTCRTSLAVSLSAPLACSILLASACRVAMSLPLQLVLVLVLVEFGELAWNPLQGGLGPKEKEDFVEYSFW